MVIKEQQDPIKNPAKEDVKIDIKRRECTLSEEMQKLLLRQLQHELQNHNIYMTFSNYYGVRGFVLLEEYFKLRADEEYKHHIWIRNWLNENDAEYVYPTIDQYEKEVTDMMFPFYATIDLEISTTKMIDEMIDLAFDEHDYGTWNWLMGHDSEKGMLRDEQVEEESISRTVRDIAASEGSWLRKEKSIMNAYKGNLD